MSETDAIPRHPMPWITLDSIAKLFIRQFLTPFGSLTTLLGFYIGASAAGNTAWLSSPLIKVWIGSVLAIGFIRFIDRVYANGGSWFLVPLDRTQWGKAIVLITGGSTGVGALLAEAVAEKGAQVVVLTNVLPDKAPINEHIHTYLCDVSKYAEVVRVAGAVQKEVGHPTIIVNNAGIVKGKLLLDLTEDDINSTFGVNTLASYWILKAFLPEMIRRGTGHIVTMSSVLGLLGTAQMTDYCASKAASVSLHQSLRFELDNRYRTSMVRTTLVLPAFILTSLFDRIHFPSSWLFNFLAPPIPASKVVEEIISALSANESRVIRLPFYTHLARLLSPGVGIMPKFVGDLIQKVGVSYHLHSQLKSQFSGADHAMRRYGPQPDAAQMLLTRLVDRSACDSSLTVMSPKQTVVGA